MRVIKKIVLVLLAALLVVSGAMLLKKRKLAVAETPAVKPLAYAVKVVRPRTRSLRQSSVFLARLESLKSAKISSRSSGRIEKVTVSEGQQVAAGDLLVRIDDRETRANLAALRANLVSARKDLAYKKALHGRNQDLYKAGGLSREKLDASAVAYAAAAAALKNLQERIKALQVQLDYLELRAPFAGRVGSVFMREGDLAAPGKPILSLNSLDQKLTFRFVPGRQDIRAGQEVLLKGRPLGRVTAFYDDAQAGLTVAQVALDRRLELPNDSYLTIQVVTRRATGCSVPLQALLHSQKGLRIMVYADQHFKPMPVTVKVQDKQYAIIEPCVDAPVAVASEAKLSLLPSYGAVRIIPEEQDAK